MRIIPGFDEGGVGKNYAGAISRLKDWAWCAWGTAHDGARQRQPSRQPILEMAAAWDGEIVTPGANLLPFRWIEG